MVNHCLGLQVKYPFFFFFLKKNCANNYIDCIALHKKITTITPMMHPNMLGHCHNHHSTNNNRTVAAATGIETHGYMPFFLSFFFYYTEVYLQLHHHHQQKQDRKILQYHYHNDMAMTKISPLQ